MRRLAILPGRNGYSHSLGSRTRIAQIKLKVTPSK
jgi:hypothetical protein